MLMPVLLLAACGSSTHAAGGAAPVRVVASTNTWGDIVRQIGGARVQVTSIISDPSTDPHEYDPTARDAAAVGHAALVVSNGLGYDAFIDRLLDGSGRSPKTVRVADVLRVRGSDANPHLWYDAPHLQIVAGAIAHTLSTLDPGGRDSYDANETRFVASLRPLLTTLETIKARYSNTPVAYTERVPEYLLSDAGLSDATPSGFARAIEDGNEPSVADTKKMTDLLSQRRIRVLIYNSQATSAVTTRVRDLAHSAGVPVVDTTETLPKDAPDFQTWQTRQAGALLQALAG